MDVIAVLTGIVASVSSGEVIHISSLALLKVIFAISIL